MKTVGTVARADILSETNGRSKGCGIVEYATTRDAQAAIAELNNSDLKGRTIYVREDREEGVTQSKLSAGKDSSGKTHDQSGVVNLSKHVYVGNLSWDVTWQDLKDHMKRAGGTVLHAEILLESGGRSKGCGLVEFGSVKDATDAILKLNDTVLNGRPIFIREDRDVTGTEIVRVNLNNDTVSRPSNNSSNAPQSANMGHSQSSRYGNSSINNNNSLNYSTSHGFSSGSNSSSTRLYVGNLDYKTRWYDLKDHFKTVGGVIRADVAMESDGVRSRGYGTVEFATVQDANYAIAQLHDSMLNGRSIIVREDKRV